jgi:hypothetical protein
LAAGRGLVELHQPLHGLCLVTAVEQTGPPRPEEILTNVERKARQKGGAVYRAEYERVAP